jgi:O-antigen/teichoic acid export membrane protein
MIVATTPGTVGEEATCRLPPAQEMRPSIRNALRNRVHRGFLQSAGWLLGGAATGRLFSLLATIAVARLVAPKEFGQLTIVQTAVVFLAGAAALGLGLAVTRQVARTRVADPAAAGRYLGVALWVTACSAVVIVAGCLAARHLIAEAVLQDAGLTDFVSAGAGAIAFAALAAVGQGGLMGLESFRLGAVAQASQGVIASAGLLTGAAVAEVHGALVGFTAGNALAALVAFMLLQRASADAGIRLSWEVRAEEWRRLWRLGLPSLVAFLVVYAALFGGQLLLSRQENGYAQIGLFNLAYRWHLAIMFVPSAIAPILLPMMTRLRSEERAGDARGLLRFNVALVLGLTAIPALVIAAASHPILAFNGSFYASHTSVLILLALATIPSAVNNVLSSASLSLGAVGAWLASDVALAIAFAGAAAALIPTSAAVGLAAAYLIGYVATDAVLIGAIRARMRDRSPSPTGEPVA